jgi:hypothetical protein
VGFYGGFGFGAGFGFGFGGGVGWFPLGFGEPFFPWYRHSFGYGRNINVFNTRINNFNSINGRGNFNYAFAHNPRAVSVMSHNNFVSGAAVNRGAFHVTAASLRGAQVTNKVQGSPTRQSFFGAGHTSGRVATPSASVQNRSVVARNTPAAGASHIPTRSSSASTIRPANERSATNGRSVANTGNRGQSGTPASAGRFNQPPQNGGAVSARQRELSLDKPNSGSRAGNATSGGRGSVNGNSPRGSAGSNSRPWEAQGSATDRGRAPSGFGNNSNRPPNNLSASNTRGVGLTRSDRPPFAGSGNVSGAQSNRSSNGGFNGGGNSRGGSSRNYAPPQRSYSQPRSYNAPSSRSYSAPSRSYSAPSQNYGGGGSSRGGGSAPSRSSGGGSSRGGGGGGGGGSRGRH